MGLVTVYGLWYMKSPISDIFMRNIGNIDAMPTKYWQYWQYLYWYYTVYRKLDMIFMIRIGITRYLKSWLGPLPDQSMMHKIGKEP